LGADGSRFDLLQLAAQVPNQSQSGARNPDRLWVKAAMCRYRTVGDVLQAEFGAGGMDGTNSLVTPA